MQRFTLLGSDEHEDFLEVHGADKFLEEDFSDEARAS